MKAAKFLKQQPNLTTQYQKTLDLLEINPDYPSLRLHQLKGHLHSFYSVSINLAYRITLDLMIEDQQIIPLDVGCYDVI